MSVKHRHYITLFKNQEKHSIKDIQGKCKETCFMERLWWIMYKERLKVR